MSEADVGAPRVRLPPCIRPYHRMSHRNTSRCRRSRTPGTCVCMSRHREHCPFLDTSILNDFSVSGVVKSNHIPWATQEGLILKKFASLSPSVDTARKVHRHRKPQLTSLGQDGSDLLCCQELPKKCSPQKGRQDFRDSFQRCHNPQGSDSVW